MTTIGGPTCINKNEIFFHLRYVRGLFSSSSLQIVTLLSICLNLKFDSYTYIDTEYAENNFDCVYFEE